MSNAVLDALVDDYPKVIASMPATFTSHQFILELARRFQRPYVEALYEYRCTKNRVNPAPFQVLHGLLAKKLRAHDALVELVRDDEPSTDIFGQSNQCALWRKIIP